MTFVSLTDSGCSYLGFICTPLISCFIPVVAKLFDCFCLCLLCKCRVLEDCCIGSLSGTITDCSFGNFICCLYSLCLHMTFVSLTDSGCSYLGFICTPLISCFIPVVAKLFDCFCLCLFCKCRILKACCIGSLSVFLTDCFSCHFICCIYSFCLHMTFVCLTDSGCCYLCFIFAPLIACFLPVVVTIYRYRHGYSVL